MQRGRPMQVSEFIQSAHCSPDSAIAFVLVAAFTAHECLNIRPLMSISCFQPKRLNTDTGIVYCI